MNQEGTGDHYANLAELLPEDTLDQLGSELYANYNEYKQSRKDWEDSYSKGLDLLGFKYVNPSQPFEGASGATHPVLAEVVTQFQAGAYKELLFADGPVRTQIIEPSPAKTRSSNSCKRFHELSVNGCHARIRTRL